MKNKSNGNWDYSCLMSVYKAEKPEWFRESIDSILNQTMPPKQFVLVKDGPLGAELEEVVSEYKEKYSELFTVVPLEKNVGLAKALNEGMGYCEYDLVARMDSDDISLPDRCEKELNVFHENEKLDIVGGAISEFAESPEEVLDIRKPPTSHEEIVAFAKSRNPFNHPSVMFRKSKVIECGGYENYPYFEDYNLWVTMIVNGAKTANVPDVVLKMRTGGGLHKRRGGFKYAGHIWKFKSHLHKMGFLSFPQFAKSAFGHIAVSIMPNWLRKFVYKTMLRKKA